MQTRKIIQMRGSQYINIPKEIAEALETKPGDRLKVSYVTGTGIFITQLRGADKIPTDPGSIEGLKKAADSIYSQTEIKLRNLASKSITDYFTSIIQQISRLGIFELQKKVDRLERLSVESNIVKGKLVLIREHKKKTG
jgi:AbrB family looped-hinge helix DNA binding protein